MKYLITTIPPKQPATVATKEYAKDAYAIRAAKKVAKRADTNAALGKWKVERVENGVATLVAETPVVVPPVFPTAAELQVPQAAK